jgi:hypothetical protein
MTDFFVKSSGTTVLVNFLSSVFITDLCLLLSNVVGNMKERDHLGSPSINGRIILRWIFSRLVVEVWAGSGWLRIETVGGHL